MNAERYVKKKLAGLASVVAINDAYAIIYTSFDLETGAAIDPTVEALGPEMIAEKRAALQAETAALDILEADMEAAV